MTHAFPVNFNWDGHETPLRLDILCLVIALAIHAPLYWVKMDARKKSVDLTKNRIVGVDLMDENDLKKATEPPPPPAPKAPSLADRIKMLVKKDPPPPPPPPKADVKAPEKLNAPDNQIKLQPKLDTASKIQPTLQNKTGFKTANADLIKEQQQMKLDSKTPAIAPLSEKKFGVQSDRSALKDNKGSFQVAKNESLQGIGGGAALSDPSAPSISIKTGAKGSTEKFSAPSISKADKGRLGAVGGGSLGGDAPKGLRDRIIERDAKASQISNVGGGRIGGVAGGVPGGTGTKQNAGRFEQGGQVGGVLGGVPGGTGTVGQTVSSKINAAPVVKKKKEMFQITGELSDRPIQSRVLPEYPAWAEAENIEAAVTIEFSVLPDGTVRDNMVVRRSSGYTKLDELAKQALRKWKFAPIAENRVEVGSITFNYTLN